MLGGRFGTTFPALNARIKAKHGAFGKFLTLHAHRVLPRSAAPPAAAPPDPAAFALGADPAKEPVANPVLANPVLSSPVVSSGAGGKHRGGEPRGGEGEGVPLLRLLLQSYGADARGWPQTREAVQAVSSSGVSKALYALSQRGTVVVKGAAAPRPAPPRPRRLPLSSSRRRRVTQATGSSGTRRVPPASSG